MTRAPRLAVWLLTKRLSAEWREFVLGDLEEEFAARRAVSPSRARRWFWWQTLRCLAAPLPRTRAKPAFSCPPQGDSMIRTLAAEICHSARSLLRAPSFAIGVVGVLALGIGVSTALFSVVDAVLLRPLPFDEPDRLVRLFHVPPQNAFPGIHRFLVSPANFYDWQRQARSFEGMAMYAFRGFTLTGAGEPEAVTAGAVGTGFFQVVRAQPSLGRFFAADDDVPAHSHVVIVSEAFWKTRLGQSPDVIGRTLTLNGEAYAIVGVMPTRLSVASWMVTSMQIWVPLAPNDAERAVRDNHNYQVIARLKPGVDPARAQSEMDLICARLARAFPEANMGWGATVVPLQELIVGDIRKTLLVLLAAVALVLLVACANAGNLLLSRGLGRRKELAIRAALGAGRARVVRHLLTDAMLLAAVGGAAGLALARLGLAASATLLADQVPRADEISIDSGVLLFALGVSLVTGILAGAMPALRAGRTPLEDALKEGGRQDASLGVRTRRLLVAGEVAVSVVLLLGAGVMLRTVVALRHVDVGFDPRDVLTLRVSLPDSRYNTPAQKSAFFDAALGRIRALPGVRAAAAIDALPFQGGAAQPMVADGRAQLSPSEQPTVALRKITPGYLRTMKVPLLRGRDVAAGDADVVLVSRAAAKLVWGEVDPIGRHAKLPLESKTADWTVVGIVGDVRQGQLSEPAMPAVYLYTRDRPWSSLSLVVGTSVPPTSLAQAAAGVIHAIDAEQPVQDIRAMEDVLDDTLTSQRFSALVLGLFASMGLVLAAVGIYSVVSYIVRGRRHELGIRTALGAQAGDVVRLVVSEGMVPAAAGIGVGVVAALASAKVLERLVFGVSPSDPLTLAIVAGTLAIVALAASLVPALRATRLDPVNVLRGD